MSGATNDLMKPELEAKTKDANRRSVQPDCSPAVSKLLKDKKFMNRLAWRVSWEIVKQMLPWLIVTGAAFWLGSWMTIKLLLR